MAINLTKIVKEWIKADVEKRFQIGNQTILYNLLQNLATEIEANKKEIEKLKGRIETYEERENQTNRYDDSIGV